MQNTAQSSLQNQAWKQAGEYLVLPSNAERIFSRQWGDPKASADQTVLLLHGFPESSYSYHKVIDGLLSTFKRVVVFDMLGYGLSNKPDGMPKGATTKLPGCFSYSLLEQADIALEVWRQLGVTGGHIISHDMGTSVLTEIVARHVEKDLPDFFNQGIQSLTFTNGSMVLEMAELRVMQRLLLSPLGALISKFSSYGLFRKSIISAHGALGQGALSEHDIQQLWNHYCINDGYKKSYFLIRYLHDRKRFEKSRWLPLLTQASQTIPTHFCWGEDDQVARVTMARYLAGEVCPNSTLTVMPGVGHFCQLGSPERWLTSVQTFYQTL